MGRCASPQFYCLIGDAHWVQQPVGRPNPDLQNKNKKNVPPFVYYDGSYDKNALVTGATKDHNHGAIMKLCGNAAQATREKSNADEREGYRAKVNAAMDNLIAARYQDNHDSLMRDFQLKYVI